MLLSDSLILALNEEKLNMAGMNSKILVLDSEGQELFSCTIEEREKAFEYAKSMEEMGIEVTLSEPSLPETLATSLGMEQEEGVEFRKTLIEEIEEHDVGCCFHKEDS